MAEQCNTGVNNTASKNCPIPSVPKQLIIVPTFADDGTRNEIDLDTDVLIESFFVDKFNQSDDSKRWFPTPLIENIEDVRADSIVETLNSNESLIVQKGVRTFNGMMIRETAVLLGKIESAKCVDISVYVIDIDGGLVGSISPDGTKLRPIKVNNDTWDANLVKTTDTTVQKVSLKYDYSSIEKDSNIRMIQDSSITDYTVLGAEGLFDVNAAISVITATGFVAELTLDYGDVTDPEKVLGFVAADFELFNETDLVSVVITSVTEAPDGTYTFVIPSTVAKTLTLKSAESTGVIVKTGFEVVETTIVTP